MNKVHPECPGIVKVRHRHQVPKHLVSLVSSGNSCLAELFDQASGISKGALKAEGAEQERSKGAVILRCGIESDEGGRNDAIMGYGCDRGHMGIEEDNIIRGIPGATRHDLAPRVATGGARAGVVFESELGGSLVEKKAIEKRGASRHGA